MNLIEKSLFAGVLLLGSSTVLATNLSTPVPVGQQGGQYAGEARPRAGLTKAQVSERFGAPGQKVAAVGDPPISRWVYEHYTVYFEYDHVIHSVLHQN
ncbi:MAG: hypothetical protein SV765_15890 [Pseudomonadota bacterium]|nr:hypothetical protein [Pseudomonadales bacterium]MDY6921682.1 hypothetical protein [Pseudomonadota bacterium]